jgi:hypothetical protein
MAKRKLYSLNALALECGRNFRTLSRALENVKPDGRAKDGKPRWFSRPQFPRWPSASG